MSGGESEERKTLEFTPTWVVAAVCMVIVALSLAAERFLHYGGKFLKRKNQTSLYEALQKIKEELMLMGFILISLLLTVFQNLISKFCFSEDVMAHLLPCKLPGEAEEAEPTSHLGGMRRLFAEEGSSQIGYCAKKHKVPLLSLEALHHLHIFIFVLAIVHVSFCISLPRESF
ncbi:MLO-like protein 1 [Pyrus x bretschneideri]|uniref:MLO-like protein 1 n=1 Tax=Pyrus x bretschneideri TaxID=225117 RepID=UPI00202F23BB|nr:MLO-like protein 1 [Pyrus x bretschneideri]